MSTEAKKRDLVVTRVFAASIEQVWKAWVEAEKVKQWWGPTGFTCTLAEMDFREGGTSLVCMRAPKEVRNVNTFKGKGDYKTELTVTEYGYTTNEAVNLSKQGLEQCLDKMAASFARAQVGFTPMTPGQGPERKK